MKILVADDDAVSCRMRTATLARWGYQVCEASDGTEAWNAVQGPKVVERLGRRIRLESVPGRGVAFHFTLPAEACAAEREGDAWTEL